MTNQIQNKEATWKVYDIPIYGTITAPTTQGKLISSYLCSRQRPHRPKLVLPLLPGTNGSAKRLAQTLAEQGYVTLRYDKVASGPNVSENFPKLIGKISMQTHLEELDRRLTKPYSQKKTSTKPTFLC